MSKIYGKNVFITGASSGIGKACADAFAKAGYNVTGVSRNCETGKTDFPGGGSITMRRMDTTDESAVSKVIGELPETDIAILCAGMGVAGPIEDLPMELARQQFEVNYFGTLNCIRALLPAMRAKKNGLIIIIGSIAGRVSIPMQSQYSASKYALEALSDSLRMEVKGDNIKAVIIEPGDTKTGFTAARVPGIDASSPRYDLYKKSISKMEKDEQTGKSPDTVAAVALKLAERSNPPVRVAVGASYKALMFLLRLLPDRLREFIISKMYL